MHTIDRAFYGLMLGLLCGMTQGAQAQVEYGGHPMWDSHLLPDLPMETLPAVDREALAAQDAVTDLEKTAPWRFGVEYEVSWSPETHGLWTVEGNERVWRLVVHCPEALGVSFLFDTFTVPKGARLFTWNAERTVFRGAFDHRSNADGGSWALGQTPGDRVVLEYREPLNAAFAGLIHLTQVVHSYRGLFGYAQTQQEELDRGPFGNSGACNINVNCPEGATWSTEKRSVALIVEGGSAICTGALVNNTAQDGTPYFLTANHCVGNNTNSVANWIYYFNHESAGCSGSSGPTNQSISGSSFKAKNAGSDFALLELNSTPPASFNVQYAGWDRSGVAPTAVTSIHHPSGDVKKICFDEDGPVANQQGGAAVWYISQWEAGVTEPGSSGSPLFDQNHRVVGQLYGGGAACAGSSNNGQPDWYGRFNVSWDGNSPTTRLRDWLDPAGMNPTVLNGWPSSTVSFAIDAGVGVTGIPTEVLCGVATISPVATLQNMGSANLTSATIQYSMNGGPQQSVNWTGNLAQFATANINLPPLTVADGTNTLVVSVVSPNGVADENALNNQVTATFSSFAGPTYNFQLVLVLDDYGSETSWEIRRLGQVVYSGSGYQDGQDGTQLVFDLCLEDGCYVFQIEDSYGDGMCCGYGNGSWTILDPQGDVIDSGGSFDDFDGGTFCTVEMSVESAPAATSLRLYPNPAQGQVRLEGGAGLWGTWSVRDVQGREVQSGVANGAVVEWQVGDWPAGSYWVDFRDADGLRQVLPLVVVH